MFYINNVKHEKRIITIIPFIDKLNKLLRTKDGKHWAIHQLALQISGGLTLSGGVNFLVGGD